MAAQRLADSSLLASVLQYLPEREVAAARRVSPAWQAAAESEEYWGMRCERDGLAGLRPVPGMGREKFYRQFALRESAGAGQGAEGRAGVEWLLWHDDAAGEWVANEDLLGLVRSAGSAGVVVLSAVPAAEHPQPLGAAAAFLNASLRIARGGFPGGHDTPPTGRVGLQAWAQPACLDDGRVALFVMARGAGRRPDDTPAQAALRSALQQIVYTLSSDVFVFDSADDAGAPAWWAALLPASPDERPVGGNRPDAEVAAESIGAGGAFSGPDGRAVLMGLAQALYSRDAPCRSPRLHVAGRADLTLPDLAHAAPDMPVGAAVTVAMWLAHFEEVLLVGTADAAALADGALGTSQAKWGAAARAVCPGAVWQHLGSHALTAGQFAAVLQLCAAELNTEGGRAQPGRVVLREATGEAAADKIFGDEVAAAADFYNAAIAVELDNAPRIAEDMARHGETCEPPANAIAPLDATALIYHHEQHFFSACRRLVLTLAAAGVTHTVALKYFEILKNKISDRFRTAWCANQGRSKEYCLAIFDLVFEKFYPPLPEAADGDDAPDAAAAAAEPDAKESAKRLRKFYTSFVDHLDEYEMKAIGTRRGDVMLSRVRDLLERVQQDRRHGFRPDDFALAAADITKEVTRRVVGVTQQMQQSRGELQMTCALYTKLLGMQCKQRLAASLRETWSESQATVAVCGQVQSALLFSTLGRADLGSDDYLMNCPQRYALARQEAWRATEMQATEDITAFVKALPAAERSRYSRFGVVSDPEVVKETTLQRLGSQAHETTSRLREGAKGLFGRWRQRVA